jgi:hypothetical protein
LNQPKNARQRSRGFPFRLEQQRGQRGLSVSALNADRITEIAMVTANC